MKWKIFNNFILFDHLHIWRPQSYFDTLKDLKYLCTADLTWDPDKVAAIELTTWKKKNKKYSIKFALKILYVLTYWKLF